VLTVIGAGFFAHVLSFPDPDSLHSVHPIVSERVCCHG
jgi:hypothetical protein